MTVEDMRSLFQKIKESVWQDRIDDNAVKREAEKIAQEVEDLNKMVIEIKKRANRD